MARTPTPRTHRDGTGFRIGIVTAQFNGEITKLMLEDALARAREQAATVTAQAQVPGSYDLPLAAQALLRRPDVDAVVVLGAIITGETKHDELIAHACAQALTRLALDFGKPVGLGVTGPGQTEEQARARVARATAAVDSVVKQLQTLAALQSVDARPRRA